jgi:hypothetical protein
VSPDGILNSMSDGNTRLSRYTVTPPEQDKWHKNAYAISKIAPGLRETVDYIRDNTEGLPAEEFDLSVDPALLGSNSKVPG